jgi:hexosaminidase
MPKVNRPFPPPPRRGTLRSIYRRGPGEEPGRFDVAIELNTGRFESGDLIGMCTGIAMHPTAASAAVPEEALSTRLVLRPDPSAPVDRSRHWKISGLRPSGPAVHANDGPVSAWIEHRDGTTSALDVVPAVLDTPRVEPKGNSTSSGPVGDPIPSLLPRPVSMMSDGAHRLRIGVEMAHDPEGRWPAIAALARRLGIDVAAGRTTVKLDAAIDSDLAAGAYELEIDGSRGRLRGASPAAVTHGMITVAQLVAAGMPERVHIADAPQYGHRGLSVDLARRWFEPTVVERLIDLAAWRKLSHLQLHLTDDEAWRVPVAAYPALTEIGGVRGHGLAIGPLCGSGAAPHGRAYTPAEIGRWVERAEGLAVELVPEIDIPGHCHAALVAVPELRDPQDRSHVVSVQGFRDNVLVPGPTTTRFLHEAFGSLANLFPNSSVLHVGGDEVPSGAWTESPRATEYGRQHGIEPGPAMAAALIAEAAGAIAAAGRGWAGWQEVAQFDHAVAPAYVVAWTSASAISDVLGTGHRVVAAPGDAYYLDMAVDDVWSTPGASWAGPTPMATTCDLDLSSQGDNNGRLIGGQAAIWGEHIGSLEVLDELLFPRLDAVAEATWAGDTIGRAEEITRRSRHHPTVLRQASPPRPTTTADP